MLLLFPCLYSTKVVLQGNVSCFSWYVATIPSELNNELLNSCFQLLRFFLQQGFGGAQMVDHRGRNTPWRGVPLKQKSQRALN